MSNILPTQIGTTSYRQIQFMQFGGSNSSSANAPQQYVTDIHWSGVTYPIYVRIKYSLANSSGTAIAGTIIGAGSTSTRVIGFTTSYIYWFGNSCPFSSGTGVHTLEIVTRSSSTWDLFIDGVHKQSASSITTTTGALCIGSRGNKTYAFGGRIYDIAISLGMVHRRYVPCMINGSTTRYLWDIYRKTYLTNSGSTTPAYATYVPEAPVYIPGFFQGKIGLGRQDSEPVLAGTASDWKTTSAWSSTSTTLPVKISLTESTVSEVSLLQYIKNATTASVSSYTVNQVGSAMQIPGFSYSIGTPATETLTDFITGEPFTSWYVIVTLRKSSGTSVPAGKIKVTVNWSYQAPTLVHNPDIYEKIGLYGGWICTPAPLPIDLREAMQWGCYLHGTDSTVATNEVRFEFGNPTNLWIRMTYELGLWDSGQSVTWDYDDIILAPGQYLYRYLETDSGGEADTYSVDITVAVLDGDESNAQYVNSSWSF